MLINNAGIMPFDDAGGVIDDAVVAQDPRHQSARADPLDLGADRESQGAAAGDDHSQHIGSGLPSAGCDRGLFGQQGGAAFLCAVAALSSFATPMCGFRKSRRPGSTPISSRRVGTRAPCRSTSSSKKTMAGLATDAEEVIVEEIKALRDNPGSNEHALINAFNQSLVDNPIPV